MRPTAERLLHVSRPVRGSGRTWDLRRRAIRDGAMVAATLYVLLVAAGVVPPGTDAHVYWLTGHEPALYQRVYAYPGYYYSPVFAQVLGPLAQLPQPLFGALWKCLLLAAVYVTAGRWAWLALLIPFVDVELFAGNINLLIAAAILVGFRHPAVWSFVLLTKVSPGVGLLWFVVRREWRNLAVAMGATAALLAVSVVLAPQLWRDWITTLLGNVGIVQAPDALPAGPLLPRLALAAVLVAWGAATDRRWTLPLAATLALPVIYIGGLAILLACVPLADPEATRALRPSFGRAWSFSVRWSAPSGDAVRADRHPAAVAERAEA